MNDKIACRADAPRAAKTVKVRKFDGRSLDGSIHRPSQREKGSVPSVAPPEAIN